MPLFFALRRPKTTVFTMFFASCSKHHGIYNVFWLAPSKSTGIYAVFSMLREELLASAKKNSKHLPKSAQNGSKKHLFFFPTPDPEKRENITGVKDFGGSAISLISTFYI